MNFKRWMSEWQSVSSFQDLPHLPGIIAISTTHKNEVIYVTKLGNLRDAEDCNCQFGNVANLLSVLLPDFRILYWIAPPDDVVSAQLGTLVDSLVKEVEPRLNTKTKSESTTNAPKALPAELVEEEEILV